MTNLEKKEGDDGGRVSSGGLGKTKRSEEGRCVQEGREERQDGENMQLGHTEHFGGMVVIPVSELMRYVR